MILPVLSVGISIFFLYISAIYLGYGDSLEEKDKDASNYFNKSKISLIFAGIFMILGWVLYFI